MPRRPAERRPSYGPNSPTVGERGGRTRDQIVESTLRLFEERGFHATLVDDIARDASVSRATLYQYFESKEALFLGLVEESGAALIRVVNRLGPLGPTSTGFQNLSTWLREWAGVFDKYATIFVQWANVNSPEAELSRRLGVFLESHTTRLSRRISAAAPAGVDPTAAAVLFLSMLERGHYIRHLHWSGGRRAAAFTDDLAVALQLYLFPATPLDVFTATGAPSSASISEARPRTLPTVADGNGTAMPRAERTAALSPQGQRTVHRLLDAGAQALATNGFAMTSVEQIVSRAGVARGTFYKYFDDRLDLLRALSDECSGALDLLYDEFARIDPDELRPWLQRFLEFRARYSGVLRVWTERLPDDPTLAATSVHTADQTVSAFRQLSQRLDGVPLVRRSTGSVMVMAKLEYFPGRSHGTAFALTDDQVVDAQLRLLTLSLLRCHPAAPTVGAGDRPLVRNPRKRSPASAG